MVVEPLDPQADHVRGEPRGRVILEYGDYECPYSRRAYREIQRVEAQLDGRLRFAFRHFPLTEIHPHALAASAAAEAAHEQGRFWEMHEMLFHRQKALEAGDLRGYAVEIGLDVERFDRELSEGVYVARVEEDFRSGAASGIPSTPRFFVNGQMHLGSANERDLRAAIEAEA